MPTPTTPADAPPTRLAATVVLVRDAPAGPEVLMLRRHAKAGFAASLWVFPGGVVDPGDGLVGPDCWSGIDPEALASTFDLPAERVLAAHVAAVREMFEEAGVLLAQHADGRLPDVSAAALQALRRDLNDRSVTVDLDAFLREHELVLDLGAVTYWSRWVTPIQEPRRYDTCFFLARVPDGAVASHDAIETTDARWVTPQQGLDDPGVEMIFPTIRTLEELAAVEGPAGQPADADAIVSHAADRPPVTPIQPHILTDDDGAFVGIVLPDDPRFPHELYR
jgi:8-oxo-dGTP pyrophosphatase MutT (NUDIX family)